MENRPRRRSSKVATQADETIQSPHVTTVPLALEDAESAPPNYTDTAGMKKHKHLCFNSAVSRAYSALRCADSLKMILKWC